MKTLKDHVILYDQACPLCRLYTKGFLSTGMLDKNGRLPYQNMPDNLACRVDQKRFVDEIALVDRQGGKVYYGVDSLLQIIGHSFPKLKPLFQNTIFLKISGGLYKFISFNRRVIIPAKKTESGSGAGEPSFRKGYRTAYLIFTCLVTSFILSFYSRRLDDYLPAGGLLRELSVCGGQLLWQGLVVSIFAKKKAWDYLGNLMTISLAGSLLLGLTMLAGSLLQFTHPAFYALAFGAVVSLMLVEHIRRTSLLGLPPTLTASWVLYRVLVLTIILIPFYAE